jgi:hypothetical protein
VTQSELDLLLKNDPYHISRKEPNEAEIRLFLREVNYQCPLCGKDLQTRTQQKQRHKRFEIAHIYPNRPTVEQYAVLHNLERLGQTSEDYENKIALCLQCHSEQDFHTTKEDYEKLYNIKKQCLERNALHEAVNDMSLEKELKEIVNQLCRISNAELIELNMNPVRVSDKFEENESLIATKLSNYITKYYTFIRDLFQEFDGKNGFVFSALCYEMKAAYQKMASVSSDKEEIYNQITSFVQVQTGSSNQTACEIISAFFVQNCEVFNEIPR